MRQLFFSNNSLLTYSTLYHHFFLPAPNRSLHQWKNSVAALPFIISRKNAFRNDAPINSENPEVIHFVLSIFYLLQTSTSHRVYTLQMCAAGVVARRWQWWGVGFIWNILSLLWAVEAVQLPTEQELYRIIWSKTTALLLSTARIPSLSLSLSFWLTHT